MGYEYHVIFSLPLQPPQLEQLLHYLKTRPWLKIWYKCYIRLASELINKYESQKRPFSGTGYPLVLGSC